jgi:pyruvate/2-oxoglutarate/acetoin dehydrogenase E1 component
MTAETALRELTFHQVSNEARRLEMRRDAAIVITGEDIAGGRRTGAFRFVDSGSGPLRATKGLIIEFEPEPILDTPRWSRTTIWLEMARQR